MTPVVKHRVSYFNEGATIFHTWYCCPDYVVRTGKIGGILVPANVKLLRFGNKRSTTAVTP